MEKNFIIDKITNSIENAKTHESYLTDILPLSKDDIKSILKKDGWHFNWKLENKKKERQLFKLVIRDNLVIQGLVSVEVMENFVEMHLIEVAPHNFGLKKKYQGVAGNLVAFACKMSFEYGFEGAVAFTAKTSLVQHYSDKLGARLLFKERMGIFTKAAKNLVNSYYKNYFNEQP